MSTLESNLFTINCAPEAKAYIYSFSLASQGEIRPRRAKSVIAKLIQNHFSTEIKPHQYLVDGTTLVTSVKLPNCEEGSTFSHEYTSRERVEGSETNERKEVKKTETITIQTYQEMSLNPRNVDTAQRQKLEQVMNRIFSKAMGRSPFEYNRAGAKECWLVRKLSANDAERRSREVDRTLERAEVWRTINPTITMRESEFIMKFVVGHRIISTQRATTLNPRNCTPGEINIRPIYDDNSYVVMGFCEKSWDEPMGPETSETYGEYYTKKFAKEPRFTTDEAWHEARKFVEDGIASGAPIRMIKSFSKRKNSNLSDLYLIAGLCRLADLDTETRSGLNALTSINPSRRHEEHMRCHPLLNKKKDESDSMSPLDVLNAWNISIAQQPRNVETRSLPRPEVLIQGVRNSARVDGFNRELAQLSFRRVAVPKWIWLVQDKRGAQEIIERYSREFQDVCRRFNFEIEDGRPARHNFRDANDAMRVLSTIGTPNELKRVPFLVVIDNDDPCYKSLKAKFSTFGLTSQFMNAAKIGRSRTSPRILASNLLSQTICKIGQYPWITRPLCPASMPQPCLAIGIDVYHGKNSFTQGEDNVRQGQRRSVIGMSAWYIDEQGHLETFNRPVETIARQEVMTHDDTGDHLKQFLLSVLKEFDAKALKSLVIFRDGVAHNQFDEVKTNEIAQIHDVLKAEGMSPNVVFAVVQKRIDEQFIRVGGGRGGGSHDHAPAGTMIVDKAVVESDDEFFLFSMGRALSTNKAVHYHVLENTSPNITLEDVASFAYNASHLYYNWAGPVKVPSMTQAASSMAFMVGETLPHTDREFPLHRGLKFI
ncbi:Piwi domain [Carpediemonas membranifera]|uniref:Piwi domain n=1 Tax=Carpediemonas membranifera TaxID=201153 RepID=A0A8J6B198_9EUKA|nr:Piwi domain [Carpediemonas membranifera]|eukprot:KAG9396300.1 Piwi domain [Carpediemonas membranifera]